MEYYSAGKRNGLLIHVIIYMNLKIIVLSKRGQKRNAYCMIPLSDVLENIS